MTNDTQEPSDPSEISRSRSGGNSRRILDSDIAQVITDLFWSAMAFFLGISAYLVTGMTFGIWHHTIGFGAMGALCVGISVWRKQRMLAAAATFLLIGVVVGLQPEVANTELMRLSFRLDYCFYAAGILTIFWPITAYFVS